MLTFMRGQYAQGLVPGVKSLVGPGKVRRVALNPIRDLLLRDVLRLPLDASPKDIARINKGFESRRLGFLPVEKRHHNA